VKLNDGTEYRGTFICLDGCLNIVLEKCEEVVSGKVINKFGDLFIRGNNVQYIAPLPNQV
jgi:U6 snRNA-associated Sm-like protein LSm6